CAARRRAPSAPRFPYTTLFRSVGAVEARLDGVPARPLKGTKQVGYAELRAGQKASMSVIDELLANAERYAATFDKGTLPLPPARSEEHTSELQSRENLVCRLLL